jgi:site-specific recombinase XerD
MRVKKVTGIPWVGGHTDGYVIVEDGPLHDQSIVCPPSLFLLHLARHRKSLKSIRSRAEDLKPFFEALAERELDWRDITDSQMSGYLETTLHAGKGLSDKSIQRHSSSLRGMYGFTTDSGLSDKAFDFSFTYVRKDGQVKQGISKKKVFIKLHTKYINKDLFEIILANVCQKPGFLRSRDELALAIGYDAGLRAAEVTSDLNLSVSKLQAAFVQADQRKEFSITIDVIGKGNKHRRVNLNTRLTNKIRNFINGPRKDIPGDFLICKADGSALSEKHASKVFCSAKQASTPSMKQKIKELAVDPSAFYTIPSNAIVKLSFHCLRHSYSTNIVTFCNVKGYDPMAYLPDQLGHSDPEVSKQYINFEASILNRDKMRDWLSVVAF